MRSGISSRHSLSRPLSVRRTVKRPSSTPYRSRSYRSYAGRGYGGYGQYHGHHGHRGHRDVSVSLGFGFHKTYVEPYYPPQSVVVSPPPAAAYPQQTLPGAAPAPAGNVIFEGVVSREDDIAYKETLTVDGIVVKVKDTDEHPLDADIEVRVGHHEEEFEDVPIGASIPVVGLSGQTYYLDVFDIHDDTETVSFAIVQ